MASSTSRGPGATGEALRFLLVVALWGSLTLDGLSTFFSGDDLMNLYKVFVEAPQHSLRGMFLFWSSDYYRPLGGLVYLGLYSTFGFDPRPFRVAGFLILLANLWLGLLVLSRLLGSRRLAALALLLVAYNARMNDLYLNFGTVYEMLCFSFYYCALLWWLRIRGRGHAPGLGEQAGILCLYVLALSAKEMAVSFPLVLLAYELLLAPRQGSRGEYVLAAARRVSPYVLVTAVFLVGKLQGPDSLAHLDLYRPSVSLETYLRAMSHYFDNVFLFDWCTPRRAAIALLSALAGSLATRSPLVLFTFVLFVSSLLPVSFIVPRSGFVLYLGTIGLGAWVVALADWLWQRWPRLARVAPIDGWPVFLLAFVLLWPFGYHFKRIFDGHVKGYIRRNQDFYESFLRSGLRPGPGAHVLLLDDPYEDDVFDPLFLLALAQHDPSLEVHRVKMGSREIEPLARYDYVLDYVDGELSALKAPGKTSPDLTRVAARLGLRLPPK